MTSNHVQCRHHGNTYNGGRNSNNHVTDPNNKKLRLSANIVTNLITRLDHATRSMAIKTRGHVHLIRLLLRHGFLTPSPTIISQIL